MQNILQQINALLQQAQSWFPWIPPSMLFFFALLAGFLALALALLILRLLWLILTAPFGRRRRRARYADPQWQRQARLKALRKRHHWERWDSW